MKNNSIIFLILISMFFYGCSSTKEFQNFSSGAVGCSPQEIEINNLGSSWGPSNGTTSTWTAKCKGKTYFCSRNFYGANCTEAK